MLSFLATIITDRIDTQDAAGPHAEVELFALKVSCDLRVGIACDDQAAYLVKLNVYRSRSGGAPRPC